jgi:hypothetical protein
VASAKELTQGFDISPLLDGKLQLLGNILTKGNNVNLLQRELEKRKEYVDSAEVMLILKMSITDVKKEINKYELSRDGKCPRYDERFFKVLYTPYR